MISQRQRDVLTVARQQLGLNDAAFERVLTEWGGELVAGDLRPTSYDRVLDRLVTLGFVDPHYVQVVPQDYSDIVVKWVRHLFPDTDAAALLLATLLAAAGSERVEEMTGRQFQRVLRAVITFGAPKAEVARDLKRSFVTPKQLALLHVALREACWTDSLYRGALVDYAGIVTDASDLDAVGFRRMMVLFEGLGFVPASRKQKPTRGAAFGQRPGMASPAQVALIRDLWREWSGADDEAALNAWLERFHHVSSLRFATTASAAKVITALKAMKRRPATSDTQPGAQS